MNAGIWIFSIITVAFAGAVVDEKSGVCPDGNITALDVILDPNCATDSACNGPEKCCDHRCTMPDDYHMLPVTEEKEDIDVDILDDEDDEFDDDDEEDHDEEDDDDNDDTSMTKEEHITKRKARKELWLQKKATKGARKERIMKKIEAKRASKIAKWQDKGKHSKAELFQKKWAQKDVALQGKIAAKRANKLMKKEQRKEAKQEHKQNKKTMTPEELEQLKAEKKEIRLAKKENRMEKKQMKKKDMTPEEFEWFKAERKENRMAKQHMKMGNNQMRKKKQLRKEHRKENKLARQERKQQRKTMS